MFAAILAAAYTFTATATGVEKGTPLEFMFAGKGTDRDYETMFVLDGPVSGLCLGLEKCGIPRGNPVDPKNCRLWPVGSKITLSPDLSEFVETDLTEKLHLIYTGGSRKTDGSPLADSIMPFSALCFYTLDQSPLIFDGIFEQGQVYNRHKAKVELKKGTKVEFTVSWDGAPAPRHLELTVKPGNAPELLRQLKDGSKTSDLDVLVDFSDDISVREATAFSKSLAVLDSSRIRLNGRSPDGLFFRAFLPLVKWRDRKERLTQPFEVTLGKDDRVICINEDWSGEGLDPKLSEQTITFEEMKNYQKTDTVFFFVTGDITIGRLKTVLRKIPKTVCTHYVFWE